MRVLPPQHAVSVTYTLPLESTATPCAWRNCPSPLPVVPHFERNIPLLSNFWIRSLKPSVMKTFPLASTAIPPGLGSNCPSPLPKLPQYVTRGHTSGSQTQAHALPPGLSQIFPMGHVPPH